MTRLTRMTHLERALAVAEDSGAGAGVGVEVVIHSGIVTTVETIQLLIL